MIINPERRTPALAVRKECEIPQKDVFVFCFFHFFQKDVKSSHFSWFKITIVEEKDDSFILLFSSFTVCYSHRLYSFYENIQIGENHMLFSYHLQIRESKYFECATNQYLEKLEDKYLSPRNVSPHTITHTK